MKNLNHNIRNATTTIRGLILSVPKHTQLEVFKQLKRIEDALAIYQMKVAHRMTKTEKRISFFRRYCTFYLLALHEGIEILPYSFHRTEKQQHELYKAGKSKNDGRKKRSFHQDRLAIDGVIVNEDGTLEWNGHDVRYKRLSEIADFVGLKTGYNWQLKDSNHTQWKETV